MKSPAMKIIAVLATMVFILVSLGLVTWQKRYAPSLAMKDNDPTVRKQAVVDLAASWISIPDQVRLLLHACSDSDEAVQSAAASALCEFGPAAVEPLIATTLDT